MSCCAPGKIADFRPAIRRLIGVRADRPLGSHELDDIHASVIQLFLEDGFCAQHAGKIADDVMIQIRVKCGQPLESR